MDTFWTDIGQILAGYYHHLIRLLPKLVLSAVILLVTVYFSGVVSKNLTSRLWKKADDPLLAGFLVMLGRSVLVITGIVLVLGILGLSDTVTKILAGAGITAFIIGFAFKDLGENFLAGILLAFKRPFRIGDTVETNGVSGRVTGISLRETIVKTVDGKDIYIPNGLILKTPLINYTTDQRLRVEFTINMEYRGDITSSVQAILKALKTVPEVLQDEVPPSVVVRQLTSGSAVLVVRVWIDTNSPGASIPGLQSRVITVLEAALGDNCNAIREIRIGPGLP